MRLARGPAGGGFTLVELLVVISVITVLSALVVPAAMRGRALARNTQCCNNLSQLFKAVQLYGESYEMAYPCAALLPSQEPSPGLPRICDLLAPYAGAESFRCPDDLPTDPDYPHASYFAGEGSSYEWATVLNGSKQGGTVSRGRRTFKAEAIPVFADYEPFHRRGSRLGLNAVFTDGHVEGF